MKKSLKIILITLLVNGLFIGGLVLFVIHSVKPEKFDPKTWTSNPDDRRDMVSDLLSNTELKGMSKSKIVKLLGQPENSYFKESDNIVYLLGDEGGLISIDREWLIIWFDEGNRVSNYEINID
ncbi:hypothetical protein V7654_02415 [Bacillus sp. JJ1609]|uniref:hypothetical protein n=1 Tax=Bacillus sp. JJ1609 TaxID=3122977 RepID=UPI002FFE117D